MVLRGVLRGRRRRVRDEFLELVEGGQIGEQRGWHTRGDGAAEKFYQRACGRGVGVRHERRKVLGEKRLER